MNDLANDNTKTGSERAYEREVIFEVVTTILRKEIGQMPEFQVLAKNLHISFSFKTSKFLAFVLLLNTCLLLELKVAEDLYR